MIAFSVLSGENAPLGKLRDMCRADEKTKHYQQLIKIEKEQLKQMQRQITIRPSQKHCGVTPIPDMPSVTCILRKQSANWLGMQTCKSKLCVSCHIAARMKHIEEADKALYAVQGGGGSILMLTLTCSNRNVELLQQLEALQTTYRKTFKRRQLVSTMKELDYVGAVRSIEVQILTEEGRFHPHMHVALAFNKSLSDSQVSAISGLVKSYWCETMKKAGFYALATQQHVTRADNKSGEYVAKGAAQEIANATIKRGSNGSVSWVGLLYAIQDADSRSDYKDRDRLIGLYRHFEASLHNKRLISISPSLRALVPPEEEPEAQEETEESEERIEVPVSIYRFLKQMRVSHLVPAMLFLDQDFRQKFVYLCDAEKRASRHKPSGFECDLSVQQQLQQKLGGFSGRDVWAQNRRLGIY